MRVEKPDIAQRLIRAKTVAEPEIPAPAEMSKALPALDQPRLRAPQLLPRVAAAIEEELKDYRAEQLEKRHNV